MKKIILINILILTLSFLGSCDKVDPYDSKKAGSIVNPIDTSAPSKVLLVEFTGYKCGFCPPAAELAHKFHEENEGRVILMSIHEGGFANPTPPYNVDFRSAAGTLIHNQLEISSYPMGSVNYKEYNGNAGIDFTKSVLEGKISELLAQKNNYKIAVSGSLSINTANIKVDVKVLNGGTFNDNIAVYLCEDSIVAAQLDYRITDNPWVKDYVHYSVFRAAGLGAFGELFLDGDQPANTTKSKEISIPLESKWNTKHLRAIALILDNQTFEVKQVEELKLQ